MISLFSGLPENEEDDAVMEMHCTEALNLAVKNSIPAIGTEDEDGQQGAALWMIQIAKLWIIGLWAESTLDNQTPLIWTLKVYAHLIDLEWIQKEQTKLNILLERFTSQVASQACRDYR